jgi:hypothetical protein
MRKSTFSFITSLVLVSLITLESCKDDSYLLKKSSVADQSFVEEFDTATSALSRGWHYINTSVPIGGGVWQQGGGIPPWFRAFSSHGTYPGFIGVDYTSTSAGAGIISNWVVSPVVVFQNGDKIVFYTRTLLYDAGTGGDSTDYANRMQVRINKSESLNVGSGSDAGDFSTTLLDINPAYEEYHTSPALYSPTAYPGNWTRFEATVSGLNAPVRGRFAFRYYVEGAGSNGLGSGVALDKVTFTSASH